MKELLDYIEKLFEKDFDGYTQLRRKFKNQKQEKMYQKWKELRKSIESDKLGSEGHDG